MVAANKLTGVVMKQQKHKSKKPSLDELVFGALSQLQALDYNPRSIRRYQSTWNRLIKFANQHNFENKLSEKLILEFLEYHAIKPDEFTCAKDGWCKHAEFNLKILWNFSHYGYFERIHTLIQKLNIPSAMKKVLNEYIKYCKEKRYMSQNGTHERIREVSLFLDFVTKQDVKAFEQIQPQHLSVFINSFERAHTI